MGKTISLLTSNASHLNIVNEHSVHACEHDLSIPSQSDVVQSYQPSFRLSELKAPIYLPWPIRLPDFDPNGERMGERYLGAKKASASKIGVAGVRRNLKGALVSHIHSHLESRLMLSFLMNPYVLECRTQYPIFDLYDLNRYSKLGQPIPSNKIFTVDFLLTLQQPGTSELRFHCVSGKQKREQDELRVVRRHLKEKHILNQWGCTHEVLDESYVSQVEYDNCVTLRRWMGSSDISFEVTDAKILADAIRTTSAKGSLSRVLGMISKRFGWDIHHGKKLLAIANFLGYLRVDHKHFLHEEHSIHFVKEGFNGNT